MAIFKEEGSKFGSVEEYAKFRLRWMKACVRLNKHSKNAELIPEAETLIRTIQESKGVYHD